MKAILVRIGVDHTYGAWNAPVDLRTGQFVFVPIPDGPAKTYSPGNARRYAEIDASLMQFAEQNGVRGLHCPEQLRQRIMHLDPDFEHLTYGENGVRRGTKIAKLRPNDLIVFYAGLRSIIRPNKLVYALVGLYVVEEVIRAIDVVAERRRENAHTRWENISENDVVVRGRCGASGRFNRCIPIGEWRDRAYRVCKDIENAWGGLTVTNGYIQRSAVPPEFVDAVQFYDWFHKQSVELLNRNN